jgi:hypothetical protein
MQFFLEKDYNVRRYSSYFVYIFRYSLRPINNPEQKFFSEVRLNFNLSCDFGDKSDNHK